MLYLHQVGMELQECPGLIKLRGWRPLLKMCNKLPLLVYFSWRAHAPSKPLSHLSFRLN